MSSSAKSLFLILSHHLFPISNLEGHERDLFFMAEDREFCSSQNFHKHKIIFHLSAMRHYAHDLRHKDFDLVYFEMDEITGFSYEKMLSKVMTESSLEKITIFEIENKLHEARLRDFCLKNNYDLEIKKSPSFIVSREDFKNHLEVVPRPHFKKFYEDLRREYKILMEPGGEPLGGRFIIEKESPMRWPGKNNAPKFPLSVHDEIDKDVIRFVDETFPENPGQAQTFWYPTSRKSALETFEDFCQYRLAEFGPYEFALASGEDFLFHSVLASLINVGLLLPSEMSQTVLEYYKENPVPLHSLESYIRQLLGWREYSRGIYQNFSEKQEESNFWNHHRILNENWRKGTTGVPPLDDAIDKAKRLSYNHHVERLLILCNMMNLSEIHPKEVYRWFLEMHIDSANWVTGPNVFGLGLHSDGGIVSDRVYICSSNYWRKISNYKKEPWCDEVDGLYWRFIEKHRNFFSKNPQLYIMTKNLDKMTSERHEILSKAADAFLKRNTIYP